MLLLIGIGFAIYWAVWTIIYIWFVGFDFRYYWYYFRLSWWNPGEIPALIRFYSLIVTISLLTIILIAFPFFRKIFRGL
jgi:hypothetical protein